MPDVSPLSRLLTRPLTVFWAALLGGGVLMLVLALLVILSGGPDVNVVGQGSAGAPMTTRGAGDLDAEVFSDAPEPGDTTCTVDGTQVDRLVQLPGGAVEVEGRTWFPTANKVSVAAGAAVVCSAEGAGEFLLAQRSGRERALKAALFAVPGVGGVLMGLLGLSLRRRREDRA